MEILVPISIGELYDKISILMLKSNKIRDEEKRKNIQKEFDILQEIAKKYPIENRYLQDLYGINNHIWVMEDSIREKEASGTYDKGFIECAKHIYEFNDARAKIKKEINLKYGSDIIEEKSYSEYNNDLLNKI